MRLDGQRGRIARSDAENLHEAHCRISSYLQSMARQGYNPLTAIQIALNGNAAAMIELPPEQTPRNHEQGGE